MPYGAGAPAVASGASRQLCGLLQSATPRVEETSPRIPPGWWTLAHEVPPSLPHESHDSPIGRCSEASLVRPGSTAKRRKASEAASVASWWCPSGTTSGIERQSVSTKGTAHHQEAIRCKWIA